jgi:hypothetical protein
MMNAPVLGTLYPTQSLASGGFFFYWLYLCLADAANVKPQHLPVSSSCTLYPTQRVGCLLLPAPCV